jgi:hypothetical protein
MPPRDRVSGTSGKQLRKDRRNETNGPPPARYYIAAAFRMQIIVAEATFCDMLRIACGRSQR